MALAALLSFIGTACQVESAVVLTPEAREDLERCRYCVPPNMTGTGEEAAPVPATVDTVVVTTYRLAVEVDCRGCVERGDCVVQQRDCVCLGEAQPLETLALGSLLGAVAIGDLDREEEYCVSVATLRLGSGTGPDCVCEPETWAFERRAAVSCTYSRRAKRPGDSALQLNLTICQNPVPTSTTFLPPDDGGSVACSLADFFSESIRSCAGVGP